MLRLRCTSFHNFFKLLDIFFVIQVPFGILTYFRYIDSCTGLEMTFSGSYKEFSEKNYGLNGFDIFFSQFSTFFWILPVFMVVFIVNDLL